MCTGLIGKARQLCIELNKTIIDNLFSQQKQLAKDKTNRYG